MYANNLVDRVQKINFLPESVLFDALITFKTAGDNILKQALWETDLYTGKSLTFSFLNPS